jgi:hypothetical protein
MKKAEQLFNDWFLCDEPIAVADNLIDFIEKIQEAAYIEGYRDATKGDSPQFGSEDY